MGMIPIAPPYLGPGYPHQRENHYHSFYMREFLKWLTPKETSISAKWTTIVVLTEDYRDLQRQVYPELFEAKDEQH
jgi:hypothetical protein